MLHGGPTSRRGLRGQGWARGGSAEGGYLRCAPVGAAPIEYSWLALKLYPSNDNDGSCGNSDNGCINGNGENNGEQNDHVDRNGDSGWE